MTETELRALEVPRHVHRANGESWIVPDHDTLVAAVMTGGWYLLPPSPEQAAEPPQSPVDEPAAAPEAEPDEPPTDAPDAAVAFDEGVYVAPVPKRRGRPPTKGRA